MTRGSGFSPTVVGRSPRRLGLGVWITIAAALAFVAIWHRVLRGQRSLVGIDLLYQVAPWFGVAGVREGRTSILWDVAEALFPWSGEVRRQLLAGHLPLWDPRALFGRPFLANAQSAVFSPFTLIALPFRPAIGMSLGMLAKLWVAGFGTAWFVRVLGGRGAAAAVAGIAYAACSFMVVWLSWPQSSVAALIPWVFAAGEAYVRRETRSAWVGLGVVWALQLFGGHPETSLQMATAFGLYIFVRCLSAGRLWWRPLSGLALAVVVGTLVAGIQVVPFLDYLRETTTMADRARHRVAEDRLNAIETRTWLVPNGKGNPGIDTIWNGNKPNYNEATGFVGIGALVLAVLGVGWLGRRSTNVAVALGGLVLVSAIIVYGPLTPVLTYVPLVNLTSIQRYMVYTCLGLAVLAGFGIEALSDRAGDEATGLEPQVMLATGVMAVAGLVGMGAILKTTGRRIDDLLPQMFGCFGFWVVVAGLSMLAAGAFLLVGLRARRGEWAVIGFSALAIVEAALFAGPFNPRVPLDEAPPPSAAVSWLRQHAGDRTITGLNLAMVPESAKLFGLNDARGIDALLNPRFFKFWAQADPGFNPRYHLTVFKQPDARWLAASGVAFVMADREYVLPGTDAVVTLDGVTIASVPGARPFAWVAEKTVDAADLPQALGLLNPDGAVVIERSSAPIPAPVGEVKASVQVIARHDADVSLSVDAETPATVVVLQSFSSGWRARVDGQPASVHPANVLFQSVDVPAGRHAVILRYEPASFVYGVWTSVSGLVLLLGWAAYPRRRLADDSPSRSSPTTTAARV